MASLGGARTFICPATVYPCVSLVALCREDSCCAAASGAQCPQVTLPLPLHHQITLTDTTSGTEDAMSSSTIPYAMPNPYIPEQFIPHCTYPPPEASSVISSNAPGTTPRFVPFAANDVLRYDNRPLVEKTRERNYIPAFMRHFTNESCPWLNGDWTSCVHPEGALYLYNMSRKTFTEAIMDETTFHLLAKCVDGLYDMARANSACLEACDVELVVQLWPTEGEMTCQYYFVDHKSRILFWLEDNHEATTNIFSGLRGVYDPSHIRLALESEYWTHCERYPNHQTDRVKLLKELREVVMHASAEIITSDMSLSPFDADELSKILELINHLRENAEENDCPHSTCIIARFMHYFYRAKFFNFCGLPCARLDADKSVYEEDTGFHPLIGPLSLVFEAMLFWAPQAHLKDLRRVWVDECINTPRWKDFNTKLMTEWTGITIYSTVMLAVDVSFLAVPNMNISQSQSTGIIATYLSIIFITGSLIVSVLLARQNQRYGFESADKAAEFLSSLTGTFVGVKALATIHSLPYAMLMWGCVDQHYLTGMID
ncbi:uncharacterized protein EDB93DRAFT_318904 [Suillus bovinus]|uniref:uncharacterized protein n=1 Tax=Suillus bovinus TaxID=48563 RepID=UPI001B8863F2|nr:uncharacterized protein EDB93DRAFT_318904 [Suillus bovinus]KAG2151069.1 hypothetical protein EDB93DRAFT_318904 [Suillus bovinus]